MPPTDFTTQGVAETRRRLLKALASGPGLLLVQGPSGCGKSHLKLQLSGHLARRFTLIDLPYSRLDPQQFATTLATRLSPDAPPAADPVACMRPQLEACARAGKPLLLLIDDAQFMPEETRALLLALAPPGSAASPPVYGILFVDPGPSGRFSLLPGADPEQGLHQRIVLSPPAQADMERFLDTRLSGGTEKSLPDSAREVIVQEALGSLRRLRQLTELALLEQASEEAGGEEPGAESEPLPPRAAGSGGQFAFGLVGGDDIPGPGPATQQALERGNELDALTARSETVPAPSTPTTTPDSPDLPAIYRAETQIRPRRRLPLVLIAGGGLVLAALLLELTPLEEGAWLRKLFAQERPVTATAAAEPVPGSPPPEPAAPEQAIPEPERVTQPPPLSQPQPSDTKGPEPAPPPPAALSTASPPVPTPDATEQEPPSRDEATSTAGAAITRSPPTTGVATGDKTLPEPPPRKPASPPFETDRWLTQARELEAAYRLTLPSEDNAVLSYRRVLELDPENPEARAGLERIQALYRRRAGRALQQEEWAQARHNFNRLLWIDGSDREVAADLARLPMASEQPQTVADQQTAQQQTQQ